MALTLRGEKRIGGGRVAIGNNGLEYSETYQYIVETDDINTGREEVMTCTGLPELFISQSVGGPAICTSIRVDRNPVNPLFWDVIAEFTSDIPEGSVGATFGTVDPPTAWTSRAKIRFEHLEETVFKDANGDPVVNSAGFAFDSGIQRIRTIPCYDFVQFEPASTTIETIVDRDNKVNSGTFRGRAAKTLLLTVQGIDYGYFYGEECVKVAYSMKYKSDTWRLSYLDVGEQYVDGLDYKFFERDGVTYVGNLDGAGGALADGFPPTVLEFDMYDDLSFSFLRLVA